MNQMPCKPWKAIAVRGRILLLNAVMGLLISLVSTVIFLDLPWVKIPSEHAFRLIEECCLLPAEQVPQTEKQMYIINKAHILANQNHFASALRRKSVLAGIIGLLGLGIAWANLRTLRKSPFVGQPTS